MPLRGISLGQLKHAAFCEHAAICTTWPGCLAAGCKATISAVDADGCVRIVGYSGSAHGLRGSLCIGHRLPSFGMPNPILICRMATKACHIRAVIKFTDQIKQTPFFLQKTGIKRKAESYPPYFKESLTSSLGPIRMQPMTRWYLRL